MENLESQTTQSQTGQSQTDVQPGTTEDKPPLTPQASPAQTMDEEVREEMKQEDTKAKSELEQLPQEVRDSLPEAAQRLFLAAYNAFYSNSQDKDAALQDAWKSMELNEQFARGEDGKWYRLPSEDGGGHGALASAPNS